MDQAKKGIFNIEKSQSRYPVKFVQNLLNQYKTPRKVDNGPPLPNK